MSYVGSEVVQQTLGDCASLADNLRTLASIHLDPLSSREWLELQSEVLEDNIRHEDFLRLGGTEGESGETLISNSNRAEIEDELSRKHSDTSLILDSIIGNLTKLRSKTETFADHFVPQNLIDCIDANKNPNLFNLDYLNQIDRANSQSKKLSNNFK
ncbi:MAG: hypothetical protein MHPSP_004190, partial [Paramarteilia canceri]